MTHVPEACTDRECLLVHPGRRHAEVFKSGHSGWQVNITEQREGWDDNWFGRYPTWDEALGYAIAEVRPS